MIKDMIKDMIKGFIRTPKPKSRKLFRQIGRLVSPSRGGLNMPKFQPCPQCRGKARRVTKTMGGGNYKCVDHGEFFVKATASVFKVKEAK